MKITPQSVRCKGSRAGCIPLGNQHKQTKPTKASVFRASFIRVDSRDSRALRSVGGAPSASPVRTGRALPILVFLSLFLICAWSFAQTSDSVAEREVQRRQAGITQGEAALARGQAAMKSKDYAAAHEEFRTAITYLPDAVVSGKAHDEAVDGFCKSGVVLAEARIAEGRYADAEAILSEILSDRYDPKCRPAQELYAHLRQPGYFNKTMSPTFIEKVEQVKQLLTEADGFYNSGRYDLAMKRYDQVLALDPYNTAARHGQEKINNTKYKYGEEAYNETRSRQLWQVEKGWEQPVRRYGQTGEPVGIGSQKGLGGTAQINNKLNSIIIPRIEFRDATIREAIDFLREQSEENDTSGTGKRGVDIVLRMVPLGQVAAPPPPVAPAGSPVPPTTTAPGAPAAGAPAGGTTPGTGPAAPTRPVAPVSAEPRITITLNQIPLGEALRYIANQAGLKVKVEPYAVSIIPMSEQSNDLITKEYRVPPDFISTSLSAGYTALEAGAYRQKQGIKAPTGTGKDTQESTGGAQLVAREGAKEFLEAQGVAFPPGASANFLPQSSRLIVRNTQDNLDLVDAIVEQLNVAIPKQVEIESKFIEITQNNLKELGFDWLLGPFSIGNEGVFGSGGTTGTAPALNAGDFPFVDPLTGNPIGRNPVTAGNRSGNVAISANALDALLFPTMGTSALAPGIFGLAGVFTNPQFQVVVRALNQKKGVDLLSAPKVTTKSGQ